MPQRLLRPGLKDSPSWNACDWIAQSCYVRLLNVVDDYGRYEADPRIIRGHCFALRDDITMRTIDSICQQLSANHLVLFYEVDGKRFLQLTKWQERIRSESKFPPPPNDLLTFDSNCRQMIASPPSPSPSPSSICTPPPELALVGEQIKRVNGIPPDPKDVHDYGLSIGLVADQSDAFIDHHESRGWMLGKVKMRDWKAALRTWKRNGHQFKASNGNGNGAQTVLHHEEYKRVIESMKSIRSQYGEHQSWSKSDIDRFGKLKARKTELKNLLGIVA